MSYKSPLSASAETRAANNAALQDRIGRVMQRVADDPRQSKRVRSANSRDAQTARRMAAKMRDGR